MLLAATPDGVYRVPRRPFDTVEQVLNTGTARQLLAGDEFSSVFAATETGLFRTTDGGDSWSDVGVPVEDVYAVLVNDGFIYAGVRPAAIYCSRDGGETWSAMTALQESSFASSWPTNPHREYAHVRSLASPSTAPELLVAGVEVGGLVVSPDGGSSWRECSAVPDDVHHVLCISAERWIVSCGTGGSERNGGVYQTYDRGESWERLDTGQRSYVRESCYQDRLYTAANRTAPLWTPPDAALLVEDDHGFEPAPYPGESQSFVISWATTDDRILAGTNDGRILKGREDVWEEIGTVPVSPDEEQAAGVTSLTVI